MPENETTFLGLRTVSLHVPDLAQAKDWYANVLGAAPYFDQPFYVGFNVGGFELGLQPWEEDQPRQPGGAGSVVAYWGVPKIEPTLAKLIAAGAELRDPIQDVGDGIKVAAVVDPFGNVLGIIENPHFPNKAEPNTSPESGPTSGD